MDREFDRLKTCFQSVYGDCKNVNGYFSPGRVNLIGEHTDYNGGHVFPCALTMGTYFLVRKREDSTLRFYSLNFEDKGVIEADLSDLSFNKDRDWANYLIGVIWTYAQKGMKINSGLEVLIYGNIPNGAGLSSSASVEVGMGLAISDLFGFKVDRVANAKLCQYSENEYNGMNCGIMDQFAVSCGRENCGIFLDTADLSYEYAPLDLGDSVVVIACSNKRRSLTDSKYNERRAECEEALRRLQIKLDIKTLGDLTPEEFDKNTGLINDPVLIKRARHAVYENDRTVNALKVLKEGNLEEFGRLLAEAHDSMRYDYEATGIELDTLVEEARKCEGTVGARMTGAGFGGCTVNIVKKDRVEEFKKMVGKAYLEKIGYEASFYEALAGKGAHRVF